PGDAEDLDVRPAAGPGAGDHLGPAVAVGVAGGDVDAAGEARVVGEPARHELAGGAVEDLDVRPAAGAGGGDDVRHLVAGHVGERDPDAAGEAGRVGEE